MPETASIRVAPQLLTTSNFIGPWYHAALLFSGLGSIVLLFGVLFSQQIREDLVRAATRVILLAKPFWLALLRAVLFRDCVAPPFVLSVTRLNCKLVF